LHKLNRPVPFIRQDMKMPATTSFGREKPELREMGNPVFLHKIFVQKVSTIHNGVSLHEILL
jgi:hypothetical protein